MRQAYEIVEEFERQLADYCGAPAAVAVDSCTNALLLALVWWGTFLAPCERLVELPRRTYVGVPQAALNAGYRIRWSDEPWSDEYELRPLPLWDSAQKLERGMYRPGQMQCLSFHVAKRLPIGRGGAILLDDDEAEGWLRRARFDGRAVGDWTEAVRPGLHLVLPPPDAARGLWLLQQFVESAPMTSSDYPDCSALLGL